MRSTRILLPPERLLFCTVRPFPRVASSSLKPRWASSSADQVDRFRRPMHWWRKATSKCGKILYYAAGGTVVAAAGWLWTKQDTCQYLDDPRDLRELATVPFSKLCSGWISFAFCSSPLWIDTSETVYDALSNIPIISTITHAFVTRSFFSQFLGGQSTEECIPKIDDLRRHQIGTLLGYNIEAKLDGSSKDPGLISEQTKLVLDSIEVQGKLAKRYWPDTSATGGDNRSWVRIKVTGLLPHPVALFHGSRGILKAREARGLDRDVPYPGLPHDGDWQAALNGASVSDSDRQQLLSLKATLRGIASKARENNVRIVIDAEQTWYQPVIDSLTDELMQEFNTLGGPATCIASFQAYLRRYPQLLDQQIRRADEKGYKLLFKQVRGAYMVAEAARWEEEGKDWPGPVWPTKEATDASYNYGIEKTLSLVANQVAETGHPRLGAIFATHNSVSIEKAIDGLQIHGLAERRTEDGRLLVSKKAAGSIAFGQLYGMKDDLTNRTTGSVTFEGGFPLVVKSMSYGDLTECLPFLARRATENKAVLEGRGGAVAERIRLGREIRRRLLNPFS